MDNTTPMTSTTPSLFQQGIDLLTGTIEKTKNLLLPILVGAIVVAVLTTIVNSIIVGPMMGRMMTPGIDLARMQKIGNMGGTDAQQALNEMMAATGSRSPDEMAAKMAGAVGGAVFGGLLFGIVAMVVGMILHAIGSAYYTIVYLRSHKDAGAAFADLGANLVPLLSVWIVSFIRSLIWIPFIGIIFGILWLPRMVFAPYIVLTEKCGVMDAINRSFAWTQNKWVAVVVPLLVAGLIAGIALMIVGGIVGKIVGFVPFASMLVTSFAQQITTAMGSGMVVAMAPTFKK
jgi:hypothetical protein